MSDDQEYRFEFEQYPICPHCTDKDYYFKPWNFIPEKEAEVECKQCHEKFIVRVSVTYIFSTRKP